jgi:DNA-directed RNA polymerase subunit L
MASRIDILVTEVFRSSSKDFTDSKLVVSFEGKAVTTSLINCFRRIALNHVPTYAFFSPNIIIEENTSIYDNDSMRLRLEQLTFPNVSTNIDVLEDRFWTNVDYANKDREKDIRDTKILELNINQKNSTDKILNVTTEQCKFFEDGVEKKFSNNIKQDALIIKLRPGEVFNCHCKASLGCGFRNNIWAAAHSYTEDIELDLDLEKNSKDSKNLKNIEKILKHNQINLTLESQGQLDEYDILIKSCAIIRHKIKLISKKFLEHVDMKDKTLEKLSLVLTGEDHTMGCLLNEYLQDNDNLISGVSKPDVQKKEVIIKIVKFNSSESIYKLIKDSFEFTEELIETICNGFTRISKINKKK